MLKNYSYPIDLSWTKEEMATVVAFFTAVETFYEDKIDPEKFTKAYRNFKKVVPSKAEEKKLDREFERLSGYSTYKAVQQLVKLNKKV